ncbi:Uncharacterised protein [Vibrio cholerae]|nr:Uncharacterised protein [Vibrio cholerae]
MHAALPNGCQKKRGQPWTMKRYWRASNCG